MIVTIHASLDFPSQMESMAKQLRDSGHEAILPDLTRYQHIRDVLGDDAEFTRIKTQLTRQNMANVESCDCLLILNYTHRGVVNYIGGNSFLEMVVAFYLRKPILLLHPIPEGLPHTEEVKALEPIECDSREGVLTQLRVLQQRGKDE